MSLGFYKQRAQVSGRCISNHSSRGTKAHPSIVSLLLSFITVLAVKTNITMKALAKRKQKRDADIRTLTVENMIRVVQEANDENKLHREFSDMLLGCCSGLESVQDANDYDGFDVDRELEELEKEIALAKEVKPARHGKVVTRTSLSSPPKPEVREVCNHGSHDASFASRQGQEKDARASPSSASDNRSRSSSQSWADDLIDSNVDFLIGSCSSRQVNVDADVSMLTSTTFEI